MELKKRFSACAKSVTPFIEASNTGGEITRLLTRIEKLLEYATEKEARAKDAEESGKSMGQRIADEKAADEATRERLQRAQQAEQQEELERRREQSQEAFRRESERTQLENRFGHAEGPKGEVYRRAKKDVEDVDAEIEKARKRVAHLSEMAEQAEEDAARFEQAAEQEDLAKVNDLKNRAQSLKSQLADAEKLQKKFEGIRVKATEALSAAEADLVGEQPATAAPEDSEEPEAKPQTA